MNEIGKITPQKIIRNIFDLLEQGGFTPIDFYYVEEPYILNFYIKEIPYWLFGIWISYDDEKQEFYPTFYAEKEDWIDKFKPTQTHVSSIKDGDWNSYKLPYEVTEENLPKYCDIDMCAFHCIDELQRLKKNRRIAEYSISGTNKSFIKWLWDEVTYYDIQKPLEHFYIKHIVGKLYTLCLWVLEKKYYKIIKARKVEYRDDIIPCYETGIEYSDDLEIEDEDKELKPIWIEIENSWIVKFLNKHSNFTQYWDSDDNRGFCYPMD